MILNLILSEIGDGVKYYIIAMPRKARINHPGLTHHIMARTFNDLSLFGDDADRRFYRSCLSKRIKETGFLCYAWAIMRTHVHILVKTNELPLWKLMKPLNCDYAHYYNKKYHRRGPLFSDRYKSVPTQDQFYLEQVVRYIHLNPVRAGICQTIDHLDKYPWCGHRMIMEHDNAGFMEIWHVLKRFGNSDKKATERYRAFIEAGIHSKDEGDILSLLRANNEGKRDRNNPGYWVIGDSNFQKSVLKKDLDNRLTLARCRKEGVSLDDIAKHVAERLDLSTQQILSSSKKTLSATARMIVCFLSRQLGFPTIETGKFLGIGQAAVSHAARKGEPLAKKHGISWK